MGRAEQLAAIEAEVQQAFREAVLDPATPAQARIAAARSLAEMAGLLRMRTAAPSIEALRQREDEDPDVLAARAAETRREAALLRQAIELLESTERPSGDETHRY